VSGAAFDVVAHHRRRTLQAERRAGLFEAELAKALRLLGLAVEVAAGDDCDPMVLLSTLEEMDRQTQYPEPSIEQLVELLRATDPDRIAA
jgi:hypothetical protein